VNDPYWDIAAEVCTEKQLRVLELKEKHGFSLRQIALTCDIAVGTVRVHLEAAYRNIHKALRAA